jgi:2,4-dienoyl-CoA reductase-like NADH-dependent reductase (Old Yellow Enzyme family)
MRFPLEIFDAVRAAFTAEKLISVRVPATDWVEGGWDIEQTIAFAEKLQECGCDAIHVSSGGLHLAQNIPVGPSYQVPLSRAIKSAVRIPVIAVGLISGFEQAEAIVATGDADLIVLARAILYDPRLAVACRCGARRPCSRAQALSSLPATAVQRFVSKVSVFARDGRRRRLWRAHFVLRPY